MFDSLFNLVIILIPLAIFIGRIVVRARGKHAPPPQPRIPVHFEDDDDEDEFFPATLVRGGQELRGEVRKAPQKQEPSKPLFADTTLTPKKDAAPPPVLGAAAGRKIPPAKGEAASPQKSFLLNLNRLSPLKQAVVMAEILGQPKGM